ncbi:MAG: winged helix-turn-helix domain-containing protein [Patescibacteria group bacterium]
MLKHLFTSKARTKILTIFLLNPDSEFFIRELTRELDEQINSIRRELDNLKKLGLLKSRTKNRKKYYYVNKNFILFNELRGIIIKATNTKENIIKKVSKLGKIDFLLLSGVFVEKDSPVDMLIVGDIEREKLQDFLDSLEAKKQIKYSILTKEDFAYRIKCNDKFTKDLIMNTDNIIGINKIDYKLSS